MTFRRLPDTMATVSIASMVRLLRDEGTTQYEPATLLPFHCVRPGQHYRRDSRSPQHPTRDRSGLARAIPASARGRSNQRRSSMPDLPLRIVRWRVAEQERPISDQRVLISRLRAGGLPTDDAENLLRQMYDVLEFRQQALRSSRKSGEMPQTR